MLLSVTIRHARHFLLIIVTHTRKPLTQSFCPGSAKHTHTQLATTNNNDFQR